jgi:long-chain acyl-CoA synthetase
MGLPSDYVLLPKMTKKPPFTVERPGYERVKGETIPRCHPSVKDKLATRPSEDVGTLYDNLKRAAAKFGNAKALGSRKLIKTHTENKKIKKIVDGQEKEVDKAWTYFELSEYHYMSYVEYEKLVLQCGSGLRQLGMTKDDKLHLFGGTRYGILRFWLLVLCLMLTTAKHQLALHGPCSRLAVHADSHCLRYLR